MDTKEMAQGYEENIKRAFDIIEKCKKQEKQFFGRKRNPKTLKRFLRFRKYCLIFCVNQPLDNI